jgi:DNA mismatch repair protein MutL
MSEPTPPQIARLAPQVIDQIAAGEVVERPASVVKELVENALDAGARQIRVELVDGGLKRIVVEDDGRGMRPDEGRLCVLRHATSKLRVLADLQGMRTMGFRGEALSSIASVSRFSLTSRRADDEAGFELRLEGGADRGIATVGAARGTRLVVDDLFFNTPARRKFMRSVATEQAHAVEAVGRVLLGARRSGVVVRSGQRVLLDISAEASGAERVAAVLGARACYLKELSHQQPASEAHHSPMRLQGFIGTTRSSTTDAKNLWFFVNGRFVRDRLLRRALLATQPAAAKQASGQGLLAVLFLDLDPATVDVNVHPQKTEVRFAEPQAVYRLVTTGLAQALVQLPLPAAAAAAYTAEAKSTVPAPGWPEKDRLPSRSADTDDGGGISQGSADGHGAVPGPLLASVAASGRRPSPDVHREETIAAKDDRLAATPGSLPPNTQQRTLPTSYAPPTAECWAIVDERFVICRVSERLFLIDWPRWQRQRVLDTCLSLQPNPPSQRLLLPEIFVLAAPWAANFTAQPNALESYGFDLQPTGPQTYAVCAVPAPLSEAPPAALAKACLEAWSKLPLRERHHPPQGEGPLNPSIWRAAAEALPATPRQREVKQVLNRQSSTPRWESSLYHEAIRELTAHQLATWLLPDGKLRKPVN